MILQEIGNLLSDDLFMKSYAKTLKAHNFTTFMRLMTFNFFSSNFGILQTTTKKYCIRFHNKKIFFVHKFLQFLKLFSTHFN